MTSVQRIDSRLADTALMVAVCRAISSAEGKQGLSDPFSAAFVRASGVPYWTEFLESGSAVLNQETEFAVKARAMVGHVVSRTRFIDHIIEDSLAEPDQQLVILGAGFDTRAERLHALDERNVYEVDIEQVTSFKSSVLESDEFKAAKKPTLIGADIAGSWLSPLKQAGWDPSRPTVWVAEGLLGYLHGDEQTALLQIIADHSPKGSTAIFEYAATIIKASDTSEDSATVDQFSSADESAIPNLAALIHVETRTSPDEFLKHWGWSNSVTSGVDVYKDWFDETDLQVQSTARSPQFETKFIVSKK